MIRADRELLAELARLTNEMAPLALRIMDGSADIGEQQRFGQRLIVAGQRLRRRAAAADQVVIDGTVISEESAPAEGPTALPPHTVEPDWEP